MTPAQRSALDAHLRLWGGRANRTQPIDAGSIRPAIEALYRAAGLPAPRVIVVPSPGVLAFAGAFASAVWRKRAVDPDFALASAPAVPLADPAHRALADATLAATRAAAEAPDPGAELPQADLLRRTLAATYGAADAATATALDGDDWRVVREEVDATPLLALQTRVNDAMRDEFGNPRPTDRMAAAIAAWGRPLATALFGDAVAVPRPPEVSLFARRKPAAPPPAVPMADDALADAANWWQCTQAGNAGAYWDYCVTAARDVLGLALPEHAAYAAWEQCAIAGSFRYLHPAFCLVSDFPVQADASVLRWRDGWTV